MTTTWLKPIDRSVTNRIAAGVLLYIFVWHAMELPLLAATQIHNQSVTPSALTFLATDPDVPVLTVPATITFRTTAGQTTKTWALNVQASSGANMINCPNPIPVSAVQVRCISVSVANGGNGACSGPFNLSTGLQNLAGGREGTGNAVPYTIVVEFTFQDSWRFIATNSPCTVNLSYQIIAN
jgi:hypothetical protein